MISSDELGEQDSGAPPFEFALDNEGLETSYDEVASTCSAFKLVTMRGMDDTNRSVATSKPESPPAFLVGEHDRRSRRNQHPIESDDERRLG